MGGDNKMTGDQAREFFAKYERTLEELNILARDFQKGKHQILKGKAEQLLAMHEAIVRYQLSNHIEEAKYEY